MKPTPEVPEHGPESQIEDPTGIVARTCHYFSTDQPGVGHCYWCAAGGLCPINAERDGSVQRANERLTIELAGRRFPVVALICPQDPDGAERSEWDRSLGVGPDEHYIPAENGLLFALRRMNDRPVYEVHLNAATCELVKHSPDPATWIPRGIGLLNGRLVTLDSHRVLRSAAFYWLDAEPDWIVELIDRLSTLPLPAMPDGPTVRMVDPDTELERT